MPPSHRNSSVDENETEEPLLPRRVLRFDGAINVRDLGGVATASGQPVRFGLAYRSDELAELSAVDLAELEERSVRTVVDLRSSDEAAARPSRLPRGATVVLSPFPPGDRTAAEVIETLIAGALTPEQGHQILLDSYHHNVVAGGPAMATVIRSIIHDPPVLFHCAGGKDRTGVVAAVILALLGVDRLHIIEDYMLTNDRLNEPAGTFQLKLADFPEEAREVLITMGMARPDYIQLALDVIDNEYGGIDAYARNQISLTRAEVDALRKLLLSR